MKQNKIKLNVMLFKKGINIDDPASFIKDYSKDSEISFDKGTLKAILYKRLGVNKQPDWVKTYQNKIGGVDLTKVMPSTQSSGLSLFIEINGRIFAVNFGTGHFNVLKSVIDRKFGIYVAKKLLNSDENTAIKSAKSRVNETNPINKERQYGANISNDQLYLALEDNEALRELTVSHSGSQDFYKLIGKYNSLNVQFIFQETEIPCLQYLPAKLEKLLEVYESVSKDDIRQLFKGLYPKDEGLDELVQVLVEKLSTSDESFFLFEPELDFDFSHVSQFKIVTSDNKKSLAEELLLSNYLELRSNPQIEDLENDMVYVLDEDDKEIKSWSLLECLYGEIEFKNTNYIISHGDWFEITKEKYDRITSKIDEILDEGFDVPAEVKDKTKSDIEEAKTTNPNGKINKERIFNRNLCDHLKGHLFDEGSKQITLYEDRFEVCDVLVPNEKKFVHAKYNYGADALSHLFNQGFVSAKAYAEFKEVYSQAVNKHIGKESEGISEKAQGSKICYLILNDRRKDRLTFFSKMVLEERIRVLEAYGFSVTLSWVRGVYL